MSRLNDSKLTFADMRLLAVIANNATLRAVLIRGDYPLARKLLLVEDGEVVEFSDDELSRIQPLASWWEPVDGDHRRIRRTCRE